MTKGATKRNVSELQHEEDNVSKKQRVESYAASAPQVVTCIEKADGSKFWYVNGKLHRDNGLPAIEKANSDKAWFVNGLLHRDNDLPAVEYADGSKYFYIYCYELGKLKRMDNLSGIERKGGNKEWWKNGNRHRDNDLPAVKCADGSKYWCINGKLHRDNDLPAIETADGDKEWYINGELHRDNDLPACEYEEGSKHWYVNGKCHRENDLPTVEKENGTKEWHNAGGGLHRLGGLPAIENANGYKFWRIYDEHYTYEEVIYYYETLTNFGRYCLKKIRMNRLKRVRMIHKELLCMPPKGSYPGGQDYHEAVSYFMSM
jgi:antitoxin component YwqK of YwqJK toxin-antitoxin module